MNNQFTNFGRSLKFCFALKPGNNYLANQRLKAIENSGAKLLLLEKLYQDKLKFPESENYKDQKNQQFNQHKNSQQFSRKLIQMLTV